MSDSTPILSLPLLMPAQAQKHVTHNEALQALDVLVQGVVIARQATPPAAPSQGDRYIVTGPAVAAWASQEGRIAAFLNGAWAFFAPRRGWRVHVLDDGEDALWTGSSWQLPDGRAKRVAQIGVSATSDTTNRLSVSSPATLLNHAGAGHQVKINKATAKSTASLLYQTNFSGRAELGLNGSDDLSIKTSADGNVWTEALKFAGATGLLSGAAVQNDEQDATPGRLARVGAFGIGAVNPAGLAAGADADSLFGGPTGVFTWTEPPANAPAGSASVLHLGGSGRSAAQVAVTRGDAVPRAFVRSHSGADPSTPTPWAEILHKMNMVGTVAREGNDATGAVLERGSSANGEYVRFADGTQICTGTMTVAGPTTPLGAIFQSAVVSWTYPKAFPITPTVVGQVTDGTMWAGCAAPGSGAVQIRALSAVSSATTVRLRFVAIGRWV